jgi:fido (protein-threonine AMPylation protein)
MNHCVCIDYIIDNLEKPLTVKFIKTLHEMLMYGTVDDRKKKVFPGEYRNSYSNRKEAFITPAGKINEQLLKLLESYEKLDKVSERDILAFHVCFERVFPFEDGNGRVGRLLLFKECLRHGIMPFILDDKRRTRYLEGLRVWDNQPDVLLSVVAEALNRFKRQIDLQSLGEYRETLINRAEEEQEDEEW